MSKVFEPDVRGDRCALIAIVITLPHFHVLGTILMVRKMGVFGPAQRADLDAIFALVEPGQAINCLRMPDTQRDAHVKGLPG